MTRPRLLRAGATLAVLAAITIALWLNMVPCIFASVCHVPCPGCGSTRAVLALLRGDLDGVLRYNPFGPVVAVLLVAFGVRAIATLFTRGEIGHLAEGRIGRFLVRAVCVVGVLEVSFWLSRFFGAFGGPVPV